MRVAREQDMHCTAEQELGDKGVYCKGDHILRVYIGPKRSDVPRCFLQQRQDG